MVLVVLSISACIIQQKNQQQTEFEKAPTLQENTTPPQVLPQQASPTQQQNITPPQVLPQQASPPKLTTKISPATDLTGRWIGKALVKDNADNPNCEYEWELDLNLTQQGNNIQGTYAITIKKATHLLSIPLPCLPLGQYPDKPITGSVSSSSIGFTDNFTQFSGSFTSDLMTLNFESCPNQQCADGSVGVGIKGTAKLVRQP